MSDRRVFDSPEALARAAGEFAFDRLARAVQARGHALLALAGGSTPRATYTWMARHAMPGFDWTRVHFFWSDERWVAAGSPDSNYGMARQTLLEGIPVPADHVHAIPTVGRDPAEAARTYESTLREFLGGEPAGFDLAFLGLGPDGHTASLFPGDPALGERDRWVVSVPRSPRPPECPRVTATIPLLNRSRTVLFLVEGPEKADILARVAAASRKPDPPYPASRVRGRDATWWYVDRAAAGEARRVP
ncbi:MAG TPA: 6-phosphogluconolactonase [Thermoplasmata archaeon]|nr:6-phosphogluconolactonase [Thermoplasmata archaeon]